jgi:hypothetical protein
VLRPHRQPNRLRRGRIRLTRARYDRTSAPPASPRVCSLFDKDLAAPLQSGYIRIKVAAGNCETDDFEYDVRVPLDDLSDEVGICKAESPSIAYMLIDDPSDRG